MKLNPEKFKKQLQSKKREVFHIETGDNLEVLKRLNPNQFHSMVTDPPAGIGFMGKDWDSNKGSRDNWIQWLATTMAEAMRVLKPGAYALVWAIPRTQHWTMMALENAGFEVRDVVYHLFGQGFPKSHDISKAIDKGRAGSILTGNAAMSGANYERTEKGDPITDGAQRWSGWGSSLKPAVEAWILVQKPIDENSIAENVLKHGVGGLNIDGSRTVTGRFPSNVILDEEAARLLDEQSGLKCGAQAPVKRKPIPSTTNKNNFIGDRGFVGDDGKSFRSDSGGASRFFYVAKASSAEKNYGLEGMEKGEPPASARSNPAPGRKNALGEPRENFHPTVKPIALMKYLITLITPPGGTVLDPFMGSGTTGVAAIKNGFKFFGIDQEKKYTDIAMKRLMTVYRVNPKDFKTVRAHDRKKDEKG